MHSRRCFTPSERRCFTSIRFNPSRRCFTRRRCFPGRPRYTFPIEHAYAVSLARTAPPWLTDAATLAGVVARTGADRAESPVDAALPIGIAPSSARFTNRRCMILHRSQALLHSSVSLPPQPGAQCFPVTKQRCHFASRRCSLSGAACLTYSECCFVHRCCFSRTCSCTNV